MISSCLYSAEQATNYLILENYAQTLILIVYIHSNSMQYSLSLNRSLIDIVHLAYTSSPKAKESTDGNLNKLPRLMESKHVPYLQY
jgi:hypothetical protein